jgi:hypothetical protein
MSYSSVVYFSTICEFSFSFSLSYLAGDQIQGLTGGVAQVIEHLSSKCKSLSSNPIPPKKERNKKTKGLTNAR